MGATAGIIGTLAGAGTQATSQYANARAVQDQAAFGASVADLQSKDAIDRGDFSAQQRAMAGNRTMGAQRATAAASGIDSNSGSVLDVQASEAGLSALDQAMIRNNAAREAWGYRAQATLNSMGADQAAGGMRRQAVSTLLTGGAQAYGMYRTTRSSGGGVDIPTLPDMGAVPGVKVIGQPPIGGVAGMTGPSYRSTSTYRRPAGWNG